ncbi:MAG TPA: acylneuraminate cytidylyltransferase family protein [Candidatus Rifleibacterium sp.]|nr:acylneuraminate cytidylyltransferase family protein [Candidatus Rifleibacterium sp.]
MIWAFIPARGGSKSIPKKNIKLFCNQPLIFWSLTALEQTVEIEKIVVATDSEEIEKIVQSFGLQKSLIYRRLAENAQDMSSSESVMLEFLESRNCEVKDDDIFMLVQATSPLTQPIHFANALRIFKSSSYDSMLTCVRVKRFFWNPEGTSKNYDYRARPRRQDFKGELLENGAFYINTAGNIRAYKNRLCGAIGIFEMPEYTAVDIDEEDDWHVAENLMRKYVLNILKK